jgi:parvulin-like peptidyl-prolyl isomerase
MHAKFIHMIIVLVFLSSATLTAVYPADTQSSSDLLDEIVATVDGEPLMRSDLDAMILRLRADESPEPPPRPADLTHKALAELINEQLILKAGERKEIKPPEQEINQSVEYRLERLSKTFTSKSDFERFLDEKGLSLAALREDLRKRARNEYIIRTAMSPRVSISENDVKQYEDHLRELKKPVESYHLQHILLRCPRNAELDKEQRVRDRARELMIRLQKGASFDLLAQRESEDEATRNQGGDLGFLNEGEFLKPLERAAKNLAPDEIAGPVRTDVGFHLVKLLEKRTARWQLYRERFQEEKQKWADELRKKAVVKIATPYQ